MSCCKHVEWVWRKSELDVCVCVWPYHDSLRAKDVLSMLCLHCRGWSPLSALCLFQSTIDVGVCSHMLSEAACRPPLVRDSGKHLFDT